MYCIVLVLSVVFFFFFSSRRRHTRCALVTGVQACALPISSDEIEKRFDWCPSFTLSRLNLPARYGAGVVASIAFGSTGALSSVTASTMPLNCASRLGKTWFASFATGMSRVSEVGRTRSEEHTSELQSLMRISYAVFCLKKKKQHKYE